MQQNNSSNPPNHYITNNAYTVNNSYQPQHSVSASMVFDTTSSYGGYKGDNELGQNIYPTMSMMPSHMIENNMSSNCHRFTGAGGEEYKTEQQYNPIHSPHINANVNNNIQNHTHIGELSDSNHLAYSRKRNVNLPNGNPTTTTTTTTSGSYGYNTHETKTKSDKTSKGLRHFSMKVCEKVQHKKVTTYNEVADELVHEFGESEKGPGNEQNIRRRVYDALNVLMAMNIISKDKKEIRWLGLPSNSAQEHQRLRKEGTEIYESIKLKLKTIYELIIQQVSLQNLISYNQKLEGEKDGKVSPDKCIQLPFLVITTSKNTDVVCRINDQKNKYDLSFSSDFELNDDSEILKRLGFTCNLDSPNCTIKDLTRSLQLVPPNLSYYVKAMAGRSVSEFQEHILSNRSYLSNDDVMEFYNRINKTVFETDTQTSFPPNQQNNIDKLNSNSIGQYTYNHNSTFPHSEHSATNSTNDNDFIHHFNQQDTQDDATNEAYSLSSPRNAPTSVVVSPPYSSNEASNEVAIHHNSKEPFVQANHHFGHLMNANEVTAQSINALNNQQFRNDRS